MAHYVDLDGTLARHPGKFQSKIGRPVPRMVRRVKRWLKEGKRVKIFTARAKGDRRKIQAWSREHLGKALPVTNVKRPEAERIYDDRARHVRRNTGRLKSR